MKVGVLTFHRCINYGSYWQARCLVEALQFRGHNASILDYHSGKVNLSEWKCAYQPVLPTAVPKSDYPLYRSKMQKFFQAFDELPLSPAFPLNNPEEMESYDVVVVGSDEVWNLFHPWYGNNPFFYGDGIQTKQLISYAASFGNYPAAWGINTDWADRLRNFESISVRDMNSQLIIKNALGFEPELVLDPCLQFSLEPQERCLDNLTKKYAAVYGHNFSETFIRNIREWATNRKYKLVSIGYRNDWADEQWITADPHEFATFMSQTAAVATNFFHGCAFALRNEKPFVCETTSYRNFKIQGLMYKINGEMHLVNESTPISVYNGNLNKPLDEKILNKINFLRQTSNEYLDRALDFKQLLYA